MPQREPCPLTSGADSRWLHSRVWGVEIEIWCLDCGLDMHLSESVMFANGAVIDSSVYERERIRSLEACLCRYTINA